MADTNKVIRKLSEAKFCDKSGDPKPCFTQMHQTQSLTNMRIRGVLMGLCNYYKLANNRRRFTSRISYILRHSTAKMYAAKYKLRTRAQVFKKAGKYLDKALLAREDRNALGALDELIGAWEVQGKLAYNLVPGEKRSVRARKQEKASIVSPQGMTVPQNP